MKDLIFDFGLGEGDDTAYYLSKGFDVVGVDPNPKLIIRLRKSLRPRLRKENLLLLRKQYLIILTK